MKTLMTIIVTISTLLFTDTAIYTKPLAAHAAVAQSEIEGDWLADGKFKIRITRNGDSYQGKIIWIKPGEETKDKHNEDKALRTRDLVGVVMYDGFRYSSASKKYTGGTVYMPPVGKTLTNQELTVTGNQLKFKIRIGILSKTLSLTRA